MTDLISREDAEMCLTADITNMTIEEYISMVGDRLKGLSSVQPQPEKRTEERTETHACDCISRQATLRPYDGLKDNDVIAVWLIRKNIEQQPPVTPKEPKTGHWEQYGYSWEDKFKCSECGKEQPKILCGERIIGHWSDYCPNCGADMRESEE